MRHTIDSENFFTGDQQEYQLIVSMLLYLLKHLHPDLANVTRKLSKANGGVNPAAKKELLFVFKYVSDTKNLCLKIKPMGNSNKPWEVVYFSYIDYAVDPISRSSISDFILYVLGVPSLLAIKVTKRCVTFQLRGRVYSLIRGYGESDVCYSASGKHGHFG